MYANQSTHYNPPLVHCSKMSSQRERYLNTFSSGTEDESGDHESQQPRSKRPREDVSPPRSSSASDDVFIYIYIYLGCMLLYE